MWEQKKANAPQVYPQLYGQQSGALSGQQIPQQSLQQPFHTLPTYQMSGHMSQQLGSGMAQGLGPPPPYTPYSETQQQMKYMSQMGYNPNQYMATTTVGAPLVHPHQQTTMAGAHSYPNPYQTNPYQTPGLYNPYNPYPNLAPNSAVVMPHGFDAGARFDGVSRPVIPPPPPGVAPNAAQMAALQGQNVVIGQKKNSFLEGGSSGGYTFW